MKLLWIHAFLFVVVYASRQSSHPTGAVVTVDATVQHSKHPGGGYKQGSPLYHKAQSTDSGSHSDDGYSALARASSHWPKYPLIAEWDGYLANVLKRGTSWYGKFWYQDSKFWLGLVLWGAVWVYWITKGREQGPKSPNERGIAYTMRACWALGLNMVILSIMQHAADTMTGLLPVCLILTVQSGAQSFLRWDARESVVKVDSLGKVCGQEFTVDTMYLDLGAPLLQIFLLMVAQVGVWWFYMTSIQGNLDIEKMSYVFWLWSFIAMQMTMIFDRGANSVLGLPFPTSQWYSMVARANQITYVTEDLDQHDQIIKIKLSTLSIGFRGAIGFVCNTFMRDIMSFTIPLMLMGFSEPMDFVVYCVGVNFICTVDDMSTKKYTVELPRE